MLTDMVKALYEYDRWANRRLFEAVASLPTGTVDKEVGSQFSFPTLKEMLAHILGAEAAWLARWKGDSPSKLLSARDFPDLESLRLRWNQVEAEFSACIGGLSEKDLTRVIRYTNTQGQSFSLPLWPLMQHVANHSTHHRSELATMLTMLGVAPPPTDLVIYHLVQSGQMS
jgi:uncharacterized damage-inducible protein DinB